MIETKGLTKENCFNEMMNQFPNAMTLFCNWIDEYKKQIHWDALFGNIFPTEQKIKFHNLPYEMQVGIWIRFANETLNNLFEQPEYSYCGDLEEDIKTVFNEIDSLEEIAR
jgi:hypothetical protein